MNGKPQSLLKWAESLSSDQDKTILDVTETTGISPLIQYHQLVRSYSSDAKYPEVEVPIEMKINPRSFKYQRYLNEYDSYITEQEARERMTDYHFQECDPLKIKIVDEHYHIPGPDPEKEPTKRKFYDALGWYANYYDGKHGQQTDVKVVKEIDISDKLWQNLVVAMAVSGDYTLQEALYAVAMACTRCRSALLDKYYPESGQGYSVDSKEYKRSSHRCEFCSRF